MREWNGGGGSGLRTFGVLALSVLLAGGVARAAEGLPGSWKQVRSQHFLVLGNDGEGPLREIAMHFERVRSLFETVLPRATEGEGPPFLVLVARDGRTFSNLVPSVVAAHGKSGNVGGVFLSRSTLQFIVVRADYDFETGIDVVNHEYFHYLVRQAGLRLPLWLNEGLADFWSTARLKDDATEIGRVPRHRLVALREPRRIPFETLVQVDGRSPEYRRPALTSLFYGEAWALVHYATLGDKSGERADQLRRYVMAVTGGEDPLAAAQTGFGDLHRLQQQVDAYARQQLFRFARGAAIPPPPADTLVTRRLDGPEASAAIALAQLHVEPVATVEPRLREAVAGAADLAATHAAAGLAAVRKRHVEEALREFELAAARPDAPALAPYGVAVSLIARDGAKADLDKAEAALLRALAIDSRFVPAYSRLADVYLRRPGDERRALALIRKARALEPEDETLELREAHVLVRLGEHDAADRALAAAVASGVASESWGYQNNLCWNGALYGFARQVLDLCDRAVEGSQGRSGQRDSRGVARALAGDLAGAAEDFRAVIGDEKLEDEAFLARRRGWLAELEKGVNPLGPAELQALLDSPSDSGLWGR